MMKYEKIEPTNNYPYKIFTFNTKSPDRLVPPHWHESGELLFCLTGSLEVTLSSHNYYLNPGDMVFINSNHVHSSRSPIVGDVLAIQFPLEYLQKVTEGKYLKDFIFTTHEISQNERLISKLTFISEHFKKEDLISHMLVKSKIYELLAVICQDYVVPVSNIKEIKTTKHMEKMKEINQYISDNSLRDLSIEEVANKFNYNSSYFSRFYKRFMGITFTDYLNSLRLEKAFKMLRDTDQTVLEISTHSGFSNVRTFYNVFSKNYGLSPQQYRSKYFKKSN